MVGLAMEGIETVKVYEDLVQRFQDAAAEAKDAVIEPTLTEADFGALIPEAERVGVQSSQGETQQAHYAAVETVFRKKFYDLLVRPHRLKSTRRANNSNQGCFLDRRTLGDWSVEPPRHRLNIFRQRFVL